MNLWCEMAGRLGLRNGGKICGAKWREDWGCEINGKICGAKWREDLGFEMAGRFGVRNGAGRFGVAKWRGSLAHNIH